MKVLKLDHIALYMADRAAAADFLTSHLGFHVVDHTDRYTLVGAGGRVGKLTLRSGRRRSPSWAPRQAYRYCFSMYCPRER